MTSYDGNYIFRWQLVLLQLTIENLVNFPYLVNIPVLNAGSSKFESVWEITIYNALEILLHTWDKLLAVDLLDFVDQAIG